MPNTKVKNEPEESNMVVKEEETKAQSPTVPADDALATKSEKDVAFFQSSIKPHAKTSNQTLQFPWKLHEMLRMAEEQGKEDTISWLPEGRGFKVHKKEEFCETIMPVYFSSKKYKTFQRSLNLWGFESISKGPNRGACFHEFFVKGQPQLCHSMNRIKVKGKNGGGGRVPMLNANMAMMHANGASIASFIRGNNKNAMDAQQQHAFALAAAQNPQLAMMQAMNMNPAMAAAMFNPAAMGMGFGMNPMLFNAQAVAMRQQQAAAMAAMQANANSGNGTLADGSTEGGGAGQVNPPVPAEASSTAEV